MKFFWQRRIALVAFVYLFSGAIFILAHLGSLETIPYLSYLAWFGGVTLGLSFWIVPSTIMMLWMFKRIAIRQGVEVADVVVALYKLKWFFNRVAYDMNFARDYAEARRDSLDLEPKEKE